ncbi:MAG: hypothetical protein RR205_00690, partial [Oscillospiraceae bacterium]
FDSYFGGYPILFKETTFKPEAYNKIFFIKKDVIENNLDNILLKLKKIIVCIIVLTLKNAVL